MPDKNSAATAVATRDELKKTQASALSPERAAKIEEARARSAVAKAIRGAIWGKDLHQNIVDAVVAYCRQNQLDAVRHVEVLGGRIYLTAAFYDERGAALLHAGEVVFDEPDYINADARLDELATKAADQWAVEERGRRLRERIRWNVPEAATAAVVTRAKLRSGMIAIGVNWCGGGTKKKMGQGGKIYDADPIGDLEPAKTAQTRSRRRAWIQIADFVPSYAAMVRPIEESAKTALPVAVVDPPEEQRGTMKFGATDDPYMLNAGAPAQASAAENSEAVDEEISRDDRELLERESAGELPLNDRQPRD